MDPIIFHLLLLTSLFSYPFVPFAQSPTISRISVVGVVYCDTCSSSIFSKESYFLPGVEVHIQCRFRATSPKTSEQISFSVNRTTDQYGVYKLDIPSVDGVNCVDGSAIVSLCQASLIGSSSSSCNVPFLKSTTRELSVKSKQDNLCIYTLSALSYKPPQKNTTLCGRQERPLPSSSTSSLSSPKFYFPYLPPYGFPWPPLPQLPFPPSPSIPFPPITPFPSTPLPPMQPFPSSPFPLLPFPKPPPSLPFPFPPLTTFPPTPSGFSPPFSPPFNLGDPTTWMSHVPSPAFNLGDPRIWITHISPSPPNIPQNQNP